MVAAGIERGSRRTCRAKQKRLRGIELAAASRETERSCGRTEALAGDEEHASAGARSARVSLLHLWMNRTGCVSPESVEKQFSEAAQLLLVEAVAQTLGPILSAALVVAPLVICPPCVTV
jgi:hypothetical protein